jgi:hypothetical protein
MGREVTKSEIYAQTLERFLKGLDSPFSSKEKRGGGGDYNAEQGRNSPPLLF